MFKTKLLLLNDDNYDNDITYVINTPYHPAPINELLESLKTNLKDVLYCNEFDEDNGTFKYHDEPDVEMLSECIILLSGHSFYVLAEKLYMIHDLPITIVPAINSKTCGEEWMSEEDIEDYYNQWYENNFAEKFKIFQDTIKEFNRKNKHVIISKSEII